MRRTDSDLNFDPNNRKDVVVVVVLIRTAVGRVETKGNDDGYCHKGHGDAKKTHKEGIVAALAPSLDWGTACCAYENVICIVE